MKAKISEIFQSIQGEGKYAGVRQVFVRFYGCNMRCVWCDTPYAIGDVPGRFSEWGAGELLKEISKLKKGCHSISLTGGEPLAQADFIKAILPQLRRVGLKIYLETNGVLPDDLRKVISGVDIVAMDIKLPSSAKCRSYWKEHEEFLKIARKKEVFIKTVVSKETSRPDIVQSAKLVSKIDPGILLILQPNFFDIKSGLTQKCIMFQNECQKYLHDVRIIPQMHKFMKLR